MIAQLIGQISQIGVDYAVLLVGGVGYKVYAHARALDQLAAQRGETVSLHIETMVREDAITLYGFTDSAEQDWFNLLQKVQGVGARVALAILQILSPTALAQALAMQDKTALQRADGVGAKLALRIVMELKDKAPSNLAPLTGNASASLPASDGVLEQALSALLNLGYSRAEATPVLQRLATNDNNLSELIRRSLQELAR